MSGDHPQEPALARCVCGGHGRISENQSRYGWQVLCKAPPRICGATTSHYEARAEAIAAWNRMQFASDASLYREALAQIIEWRHNPERVKMLCTVLLNGPAELIEADMACAHTEVARNEAERAAMNKGRTLAMLRAEAVEYAEYRWPGNVDLLEWFLNVECPQAVGIGVKELRWLADQIERIEAAHGGDNG